MVELRNRLDEINPFENFDEFNEIMDEYEVYYREHLTDGAIENGVAMKLDSNRVLVTKSTREGVKYQATFFDKNCEPISHKDLDEIDFRGIPLGYEFTEGLN